MKLKFIILSIFTVFTTVLFSQTSNVENLNENDEMLTTTTSYTVKQWGCYVAGSGGGGNMPKCNVCPTVPCVIQRATVTGSVWDPTKIASMEMMNPESGEFFPISSIGISYNSDGSYNVNFTNNPVWTGPFGLSPHQYTITP